MLKTIRLPQEERSILRITEVEARVGFKRSHIYNLMKMKKFPESRTIGIRAVGWDSIEIDKWVHDRLEKTVSIVSHPRGGCNKTPTEHMG